MFETALEGSWAYKEIVEKGLAQGLERGLEQGKIQNQRQTLIDYVQIRFPELGALAAERTGGVEDLDTLRRMTVALYSAQTLERARLVLLEGQKTDTTPS